MREWKAADRDVSALLEASALGSVSAGALLCLASLAASCRRAREGGILRGGGIPELSPARSSLSPSAASAPELVDLVGEKIDKAESDEGVNEVY